MASPSPRPVPQFFTDCNILATKKERYSSTPKPRKLPPKPPSKSVTQYSRLSLTFNNSLGSQKAQIISFRGEKQPRLSTSYDESINKSYFKQCFLIEEKIGSGSFGDVYKVKSRDDNQYYAVKVSREKFKGKLDRDEKLNEVCKQEQLPNHDHLVKFYCAWEERNRLFIQIELCSMSLSSLADTNHDIPEKTVWSYLIDLLKAIDHLHSNNLIHLDIKPENIFISQDGVCKLGDFGLIFDINNHHQKEAREGDPKYLASEIMQGIFSKSADIFSLGMTILEIAADLDLPSRGSSWHMLRSGNIPDNIFSNIGNDLKTIISSMLNPNYELRPTASELLNHPIVKQHELERRAELEKCIKSSNSIWNSFWLNISSILHYLLLPLRAVYGKFVREKNHDTSGEQSSPVNFNKSNHIQSLDLYSDDDFFDNRFGNNSFDMSYSSDEDCFDDNLCSRNLCSTLNRTNRIMSPHLTMPAFSPLFQDNETNYRQMSSFKSAIQRLTFDEFSSDEAELSEPDDESNANSSVFSSDKSDSSLRLRLKMSRKNLMKTFDEIDSET